MVGRTIHTDPSSGGLAQASEKTPVELKIALLEYLGTNRSSPDSMDIIPFLLGRIKHEPHDKTRACAVLALGLTFRFVAAATGNHRQVGAQCAREKTNATVMAQNALRQRTQAERREKAAG